MILTKKQLKDAVDAVSPFARSKSSLPILTHIKMESDGKRVTFTASSIDSQIEYWIDLACETFAACVSAEAMNKIAQFCAGDVKISFSDKKASIQFDGSRTRVNTLPAADFPIASSEGEAVAEIEWAVLRDKISFAAHFCEKHDLRPHVTCVQIQSFGDLIKVFGTNGLNLGLQTIPHIAPEFGLCIPVEAAFRMTGDYKTITIRADQFELRSENSIALFKAATCKPISIDRIVNVKLPNSGTVTRKSLLDAISFVGAFNDPGKLRGMVKIEGGDSSIVQLARGSNEANAPFTYTGDGFSVGAYQDDFVEFMKIIDGDTFQLEFDKTNLSDKQMRIIDGDRTIITMPARI